MICVLLWQVEQSLFLISLCFYVLFVVFRLVLQGCGFYYSAIMTPRSQIKFCLLQVYVYKLALSQHIFLEDMEKWNGRSSLSIVESFLCCAARYGNCWERFRTPRRHVNEYFYTDTQSFVITTAVPLTIEWFFSGMSIAIETHYQNRPVFAVWRKQWKRHLIVAIINALLIAVWSSTSLLIASKSQFDGIKNYCEMQFTHT